MENLRGILFMLLAMVGFTVEDIFIKELSGHMPVGQILVLLGASGGALFWIFLLLKGERILARAAWHPALVARAVFEGLGAMCFSTALALVDLSVVASVFQALPLVITMGAALFLGETVGWRRWSAIMVGFIGVLMIIQPGFEAFNPSVLLVLGAVICIAGRDLITRHMRAGVSAGIVSLQAYCAVLVAGIGLILVNDTDIIRPTFLDWQLLFAVTLFSIIGYIAIVTATRLAEASVVTPFRYSRLVFSMAGGILIFGERPDAMTLAGVALIIGSGLYTFLRENHIAQREKRAKRAEAVS